MIRLLIDHCYSAISVHSWRTPNKKGCIHPKVYTPYITVVLHWLDSHIWALYFIYQSVFSALKWCFIYQNRSRHSNFATENGLKGILCSLIFSEYFLSTSEKVPILKNPLLMCCIICYSPSCLSQFILQMCHSAFLILQTHRTSGTHCQQNSLCCKTSIYQYSSDQRKLMVYYCIVLSLTSWEISSHCHSLMAE